MHWDPPGVLHVQATCFRMDALNYQVDIEIELKIIERFYLDENSSMHAYGSLYLNGTKMVVCELFVSIGHFYLLITHMHFNFILRSYTWLVT